MSNSHSNIQVPYTYLIKWSKTNKWYYGVKFGKNANPKDFWIRYFTSSKEVSKYRKLHGDPDIIQIRKTFKDPSSAANWENKVLRRMNILNIADCLNASYCTANGSLRTSMSKEARAKIGSASKGRQAFLGRKHSEEAKAKMKNKLVTEETKAKMRASAKLKPQVTEETRAKQSLNRMGKIHTEETKAKMRASWDLKKEQGLQRPKASEETKAKMLATWAAKRLAKNI